MWTNVIMKYFLFLYFILMRSTGASSTLLPSTLVASEISTILHIDTRSEISTTSISTTTTEIKSSTPVQSSPTTREPSVSSLGSKTVNATSKRTILINTNTGSESSIATLPTRSTYISAPLSVTLTSDLVTGTSPSYTISVLSHISLSTSFPLPTTEVTGIISTEITTSHSTSIESTSSYSKFFSQNTNFPSENLTPNSQFSTDNIMSTSSTENMFYSTSSFENTTSIPTFTQGTSPLVQSTFENTPSYTTLSTENTTSDLTPTTENTPSYSTSSTENTTAFTIVSTENTTSYSSITDNTSDATSSAENTTSSSDITISTLEQTSENTTSYTILSTENTPSYSKSSTENTTAFSIVSTENTTSYSISSNAYTTSSSTSITDNTSSTENTTSSSDITISTLEQTSENTRSYTTLSTENTPSYSKSSTENTTAFSILSTENTTSYSTSLNANTTSSSTSISDNTSYSTFSTANTSYATSSTENTTSSSDISISTLEQTSAVNVSSSERTSTSIFSTLQTSNTTISMPSNITEETTKITSGEGETTTQGTSKLVQSTTTSTAPNTVTSVVTETPETPSTVTEKISSAETNTVETFVDREEKQELNAVIGGVVGCGITVVVFGAVTVYFWRRQIGCFKNRMQKSVVDGEDNIAFVQNELTDARKSRPVKLSEFQLHFETLSANSKLLFSQEYSDLETLSPRFPTVDSELEETRLKNRYTNILPFDKTRVKLLPIEDEPGSDYINANYIPGFVSAREYIATQGPIASTINDFWRMIWEQNVSIIVMLTQCVERGRKKCEHYWPLDANEALYYGDIVVQMESESHLPDFILRTFTLKVRDIERKIRHYYYLLWPDMGTPACTDYMIRFINNVRRDIRPDMTGPIVVHCSAGVGRTGTFIALDTITRKIDYGDETVDIFGHVLELRNNRMNMVQTESQFIYIHECIRDYLRPVDEHIYGNEVDQIYENTSGF